MNSVTLGIIIGVYISAGVGIIVVSLMLTSGKWDRRNHKVIATNAVAAINSKTDISVERIGKTIFMVCHNDRYELSASAATLLGIRLRALAIAADTHASKQERLAAFDKQGD